MKNNQRGGGKGDGPNSANQSGLIGRKRGRGGGPVPGGSAAPEDELQMDLETLIRRDAMEKRKA